MPVIQRKLSFEAEIHISIPLLDKEFELLYNSAKNHYDFTVRSSCVPGEGAFLHGCKITRDRGIRSIDKTYEFGNLTVKERELQTCMKAIEFQHGVDAAELRGYLKWCYGWLIKKYNSVNKNIND